MTSYDVGQIIYVVSSQKMQVIPFVVSEEVIRKTLTGSEVTYLVKRDNTSQDYKLSATNAITKICDTAKKRSSSLEAKKTHSESLGVKIPSEDDIKSFVLENGTRVNLKSPDM